MYKRQVRCKPVILPSKPSLFQPDGDRIQLSDGSVSVSVGTDNGLIKEYIVDGVSMLSENTGELLVIRDDEDPWGMTKSSYRSVIGSFALADPERAGKIAGLQTPLAPVRIIEPVSYTHLVSLEINLPAVLPVHIYLSESECVTFTQKEIAYDYTVNI